MPEPYLALYTRDWLGDTTLATVSIGARGLWVEMMMLMHSATPYGMLIAGNKRIGVKDHELLSSILRGIKPEVVKRLLAELHDAGVFSVDDDGTIFSRRMVRDSKRRDQNRTNGTRGGNPKLAKSDNPPDNPDGGRGSDNRTGYPPQASGSDKLKPSQAILGQSRPEKNDTHNARASEPVVDMTEFDADPEPDQRGIPPEPTQISGVAFAKWFTERGIEAGAIPGQHFLAPLEYGRVNGGIEVANKLLAAYGLAECEARSARLFALVVASKGALKNPRIQWLLDRWHDLAANPSVVPGKHNDATQRQLEIVAAIQSRRGQTA